MNFISKALLSFGLVSCAVAVTADNTVDYDALNRQANEEYLIPVRPGYEGKNPYWNEFAVKFIYAPAFDFHTVKGAKSYRYTVTLKDKTFDGKFAFTDKAPNKSLSPIWNQIPQGQVRLVVEGLDGDGNVVGVAGERSFLRDFGFKGPYRPRVRSYKEAALRAMLYIHHMKAVQAWADSTRPDMSYQLNTYACKIVGATIRNEVLVAKMVPSERDKSIRIAEHAAEFLNNMSHSAGHKLAFFPPTYYQGLISSGHAENKGNTMTMEAAVVGQAYLELYDLTKNKKYYDWAVGIAETYKNLQRKDGSFPIKVNFETGEPITNACAMLHPLMRFLEKLKTQYGVTAFADVQKKGEQWMHEVAIRRFDMTGQFEDVGVVGIKPYQNLTNCTAATYASYLLSKKEVTKDEMTDALDLIRFSEDQFVYWDIFPDENGFKKFCTPCVVEQYEYRVPVDNSAVNVTEAWLELYKRTGDKLLLEKARAMYDNITIVQSSVTGRIDTTWKLRWTYDEKVNFWINCCYASVTGLLKLSEILGEE